MNHRSPDGSSGRSLLITGGAGFIGQELARRAASGGVFAPIWATWRTSPPTPVDGVCYEALDVRDGPAVARLVSRLRPAAIIHTAYRKDGPGAHAVTVLGSGHVAQAAAATGARLVHLSTDMVLDGENPPYDDLARPDPVHDYGHAKAEAEALVRRHAPDAAIVRTSLVCRLNPPDPATHWVVSSLASGAPITLFSDEIRCPVWLDDLAAALLELAGITYAGVLNVAGPQALNRYEIGLRLARRFGLDPAGITVALSSSSPVRRPRNLTLDTGRARQLLRTPLRSFDEGLAQ